MRAFLAAVLLCLTIAPASVEAKLVRELRSVSARRQYRLAMRDRKTLAANIRKQTLVSLQSTLRVRLRQQPTHDVQSATETIRRVAPFTVVTPTQPHVEVPSQTPAPIVVPPPVPPPSSFVSARPPEQPVTLTELEANVLRLVNHERDRYGLAPLRTDSLLQQTAEAYARDMATRQFFSHRDPDGRASLDRIRASGYLSEPCACSWTYATGENIAKGQKTAEQVVRDWMNSEGHKENILNGRFTEIGIGYHEGYWVQNFGDVSVVSQ